MISSAGPGITLIKDTQALTGTNRPRKDLMPSTRVRYLDSLSRSRSGLRLCAPQVLSWMLPSRARGRIRQHCVVGNPPLARQTPRLMDPANQGSMVRNESVECGAQPKGAALSYRRRQRGMVNRKQLPLPFSELPVNSSRPPSRRAQLLARASPSPMPPEPGPPPLLARR